jgi:hypothetical protein
VQKEARRGGEEAEIGRCRKKEGKREGVNRKEEGGGGGRERKRMR